MPEQGNLWTDIQHFLLRLCPLIRTQVPTPRFKTNPKQTVACFTQDSLPFGEFHPLFCLRMFSTALAKSGGVGGTWTTHPKSLLWRSVVLPLVDECEFC